MSIIGDSKIETKPFVQANYDDDYNVKIEEKPQNLAPLYGSNVVGLMVLILMVLSGAAIFLTLLSRKKELLLMDEKLEASKNEQLKKLEAVELKVAELKVENLNEHPLPMGVHPANFTFPSVGERVQYYMSNWYDVPSGYGSSSGASVCKDVESCIHGGIRCLRGHPQPRIFDRETLMELSELDGGHDTYDTLHILHYLNDVDVNPRVAMRFGDGTEENPKHPLIARVRYTQDAQPQQPVTSQVIISYLKSARHFAPVHRVRDFYSWDEKIDTLVMRGKNHEGRLEVVKEYNKKMKYDLQDIDVALVEKHKVEVKEWDETESWPLFRDPIPQDKLIQYKYLLSIEGKDVSSGLKWMLFSNSVVFMAKPKWVSWAMEDLLVPYVHYIPVKEDYSDLLEQVEWARNHDEECKLIAQHATQFMYDLEMSQKARNDRSEILSQMIHRYYRNYESSLLDC